MEPQDATGLSDPEFTDPAERIVGNLGPGDKRNFSATTTGNRARFGPFVQLNRDLQKAVGEEPTGSDFGVDAFDRLKTPQQRAAYFSVLHRELKRSREGEALVVAFLKSNEPLKDHFDQYLATVPKKNGRRGSKSRWDGSSRNVAVHTRMKGAAAEELVAAFVERHPLLPPGSGPTQLYFHKLSNLNPGYYLCDDSMLAVLNDNDKQRLLDAFAKLLDEDAHHANVTLMLRMHPMVDLGAGPQMIVKGKLRDKLRAHIRKDPKLSKERKAELLSRIRN